MKSINEGGVPHKKDIIYGLKMTHGIKGGFQKKSREFCYLQNATIRSRKGGTKAINLNISQRIIGF